MQWLFPGPADRLTGRSFDSFEKRERRAETETERKKEEGTNKEGGKDSPHTRNFPFSLSSPSSKVVVIISIAFLPATYAEPRLSACLPPFLSFFDDWLLRVRPVRLSGKLPSPLISFDRPYSLHSFLRSCTYS